MILFVPSSFSLQYTNTANRRFQVKLGHFCLFALHPYMESSQKRFDTLKLCLIHKLALSFLLLIGTSLNQVSVFTFLFFKVVGRPHADRSACRKF